MLGAVTTKFGVTTKEGSYAVRAYRRAKKGHEHELNKGPRCHQNLQCRSSQVGSDESRGGLPIANERDLLNGVFVRRATIQKLTSQCKYHRRRHRWLGPD